MRFLNEQNSFSQTQTITFIDEAPPYFTDFPSNTEVTCTSDIEYLTPEFDDVCSSNGIDMDVSENIVDQLCEDHFDLVRSFTITDACACIGGDSISFIKNFKSSKYFLKISII